VATGKWCQPDVPHKGWTCIDIEDLGCPAAICEMCEAQEIRYVHTMEHPDYPETLRCGCICAGHMEEDLLAARDRERRLRAGQRRRSRWLTRQWGRSAAGNEFVKSDGFHVVVYPRGAIWAARVEHVATGRTRASSLPYQTAGAAKLAAFDAMLAMKRRLDR
jgi:hypothetical protein